MASIRQLKSRIRSVKSTKQITKAMEMVAASKMRRAQANTHASAPYTKVANELLSFLATQDEVERHPLFERRTVKNRMIIVIASDRGLVGAYNSNVLKSYTSSLRDDSKQSIGSQTVAVGRKASRFVTKLKDNEVIGVYENLDDRPTGRDVRVIVDGAISAFKEGRVDAVDVVYTEFKNAIEQTVMTKRILPAGYTYTDVSPQVSQARYEPSPEVVLDAVAYRLIEAQVFQALLDARASEYSMQMVAMKSATDNASDIADDLTVEMNKVRQAAITQELAEISGGVEAMKD